MQPTPSVKTDTIRRRI